MSAMVDQDSIRKRGLTTLKHYWISPLYALVRFGYWDEILQRKEPAKNLIYPRAVRHYARGMAFTRKGETEAAREELAKLDELREHPSLEWVTVWDINKSRHILEIAYHAPLLQVTLQAARGNYEKAIDMSSEDSPLCRQEGGRTELRRATDLALSG